MSYAGDGGGGRHHGNHFNNSGRGSGGRYPGGGRYQGGGGGGRYQGGGGGGGRGGRYQGGGGGGGGGRSGRGGGGNTNHGLLSVCRDFTRTGQCAHGSSCHYAHVVQLHATIAAATKPPIQQQQQQGNYKNYNNNAAAVATVSSIAIWEPPGNPVFKIFTSSSDGYWRLWDTAGGQFKQEFENNMAGHVHKCIVSYDHTYLFCGFEAPCRAIPSPNITVGMVHGWNLQQPSQPPLELQIQPSSNGNGTSSGATTPTASNGSHNHQPHANPTHTSIPYAHNMAVSAIHMASPSTTAAATTATSTTGGGNNVNGTTDVIQIATGSRDGSIRIWAYRNGSFVLVRSLCGHAREVTGLVLLSAQNILWSASIDQCIRIWNTMTGDCQYCIAGSSVVDPSVPPPIMNAPATAAAAAAGHSMPITALIPYVSSAGTFILSASLDQTVKVWNAVTGECVASESHSEAITCMTIARDLGNNELLLLGMESGAIQCRNIQPYANIAAFQLIFTLTAYHNVGHEGAVKCITAGPSGTFYSGGVDGKMLVCSFCGDLGLNA